MKNENRNGIGTKLKIGVATAALGLAALVGSADKAEAWNDIQMYKDDFKVVAEVQNRKPYPVVCSARVAGRQENGGVVWRQFKNEVLAPYGNPQVRAQNFRDRQMNPFMNFRDPNVDYRGVFVTPAFGQRFTHYEAQANCTELNQFYPLNAPVNRVPVPRKSSFDIDVNIINIDININN